MTEAEEALRAALEVAGLSLQGIPEEQRAMFTSLTEEEVTRLITLCGWQPGTEPAEPTSSGTEEVVESAAGGATASTEPDAPRTG